MRSIDEQLTALDDGAARQRILRWATEKFFGSGSSIPPNSPIAGSGATPAANPRKPKSSKGSAGTSLMLIKDLNLKPSGKKSFKDFVSEKAPSSNPEKCLTAVYYLQNVLGLSKVGANHVYTCFKVEGWRVPSDLVNTLQWAASQEGWFDTKDREEIKVTTHGENHIEHDMPRNSAPKKG